MIGLTQLSLNQPLLSFYLANRSRNKVKAEHEAMCAKVETLSRDMDHLKEDLRKAEANNIALITRLQNIAQFARVNNIILPN